MSKLKYLYKNKFNTN